MNQLDKYLGLFEASGGTDADYLRRHFSRFIETKERLLSHWDRGQGNQLLDIGAHWLHQSLLYAIDGFEVTALDLPTTFDLPNVRALADAHAIRLLTNADLEHPLALRALADDSFDLVLFTEIIEHIAFNPVAMWREIYRVLKPGGRIVITTPNYYALRGLLRHALRFLSGHGGGVDIRSILREHTYAHHWKEYSRGELMGYFSELSADFICMHSAHIEEYQKKEMWKIAGKIVLGIEHAIPALRPDLYMEIELVHKDKGIVVEPHW